MAQPVDFNLINPSPRLLQPQSFLKQLQFRDDHERQYVKQISKLALSNKLRIHLLTDADCSPVAFIALSFEQIAGSLCLIVNYLFTSVPYRTRIFAELDDKKISEYLLEVIGQMAREINTHVPIHYIALQPAHEKLEQFYSDLGFTRLRHKEWMFLKI
jgi:hypothetical protein